MFFSCLALQSTDTHVSGIVKDFVKKKMLPGKADWFCDSKETTFPKKTKEKLWKIKIFEENPVIAFAS